MPFEKAMIPFIKYNKVNRKSNASHYPSPDYIREVKSLQKLTLTNGIISISLCI